MRRSRRMKMESRRKAGGAFKCITGLALGLIVAVSTTFSSPNKTTIEAEETKVSTEIAGIKINNPVYDNATNPKLPENLKVNDDPDSFKVIEQVHSLEDTINQSNTVSINIAQDSKPLKVNKPKHTLLTLSPAEKEVLVRIVEAEVTGDTAYKKATKEEVRESKFRVARVIINRVRSNKFPNTVTQVVFDKRYGTQFTPTSDGRYWKVRITPMTREVVEEALNADIKDDVPDALYFMVGKRGKKTPVLVDKLNIYYYK